MFSSVLTSYRQPCLGGGGGIINVQGKKDYVLHLIKLFIFPYLENVTQVIQLYN